MGIYRQHYLILICLLVYHMLSIKIMSRYTEQWVMQMSLTVMVNGNIIKAM